MARDTTHPLQPDTDHDGTTRRLAVLACKQALRGGLQQRLKDDFEQNSTDIENRDSYRLWSGFNRASQDRMWQVIAEQTDDDTERLHATAGKLAVDAGGSLQLDEEAAAPAYQMQTPIHGQPGGYMLSRASNDIGAGVLYEAGGNLYAMGQGIGHRDSKGERLIQFVRDRFPDLKPRRILEMGCSAGGQSADYPRAFPDAECHAIDLSPAMLRYAHLRTSALGLAMHFRQCDAANTGFPDTHFDLIVSHNLFHEVAGNHAPKIMAECFRLLAPDGVCLHQDVPIQASRMDPFMKFLSDWQVQHNDEPFWLDYANADFEALLIGAGFDSDDVFSEYLKAIDGPIPWYVVSARRR